MEKNIVNLSIPLDALATAIASQLLPSLLANGDQAKVQHNVKEKYLSRKETAVQLRVSLPTLTQYTKLGKIKGYRLGTRVLYKESELELALQKIKGGAND
ncbi:MAG: DNA-binding protein [Pseudopedobacter saltans]|uniref:DNA-binding protein n=1 Tax=Pseudopedobacter saltans TaxID=151895 RepID=A0A2W5F8Q9_9SPHI|nr:MAG: DNA-binding protein [Pseudopedobacter saltans]